MATGAAFDGEVLVSQSRTATSPARRRRLVRFVRNPDDLRGLAVGIFQPKDSPNDTRRRGCRGISHFAKDHCLQRCIYGPFMPVAQLMHKI
jgi:hypothetical protein